MDLTRGTVAYEEEHVHRVYEQIAQHFSSTRYKPWPIVEHFLNHLPDGSIGLDVGCGNGKYLAVNPKVFIIASDRSLSLDVNMQDSLNNHVDRSSSLVKIASQHQPHVSVVADTLQLPHPQDRFDFAISIAVIHHLSNPSRRIEALTSILATLNHSGKALIYVWALEQKDSRRGWDKGDDQDVMVPWVMKNKSKENAGDIPTTYYRYYHLYESGELESDITKAGGVILESGYEKDNWWAIMGKKASA
ncbi:MAG: tRNA methyltransferase, has a role in tRNA modification [Cirrosporium novae-zelandiae]|nr:MAG: tRNA methyltransferase, has a role in tRNA modification [Cirrosporium novae-zelandiae]